MAQDNNILTGAKEVFLGVMLRFLRSFKVGNLSIIVPTRPIKESLYKIGC
jgi:hypothetical protein